MVQLEEHGGPTLPNFSATFTNREGNLVSHGVVTGTPLRSVAHLNYIYKNLIGFNCYL